MFRNVSFSLCVFLSLGLQCAAVQAEMPELRIGATLTLTGHRELWGKHAKQGLEMAIEEVNAAGGVAGRPIKLFTEDFGEMDVGRAKAAAESLITDKHVEIFLPSFIEDSEIIVPRLSAVPMFSMALGCADIECAGKLGPFHTRATSNDLGLVEALVDHALRRNLRKGCVISAQSGYLEPYGKFAVKEWRRRSGIDPYFAEISAETVDLKPVALQFKRELCEAIINFIPIPQTGPLLKTLREIGQTATVFGPTYMNDPNITEVAGTTIVGVVIARQQLGFTEFIKRYTDRFGEAPARPASNAYDAIKLIAATAAKTGTGAKALRDGIVSTRGFMGVSGIMKFRPDGERLGELIEVVQVMRDKTIRLSR